MNNKSKGILAGVAGIALLAGGSTFALWSDSATSDGATIANGDLSVSPDGGLTWVDANGDPSTAVDLPTFQMVPGDTLVGTQEFDVVVQGTNLVADLTVSSGDSSLPAGVSATYEVLSSAGDDVASTDLTNPASVTFAEQGPTSLTVKVTVAFDEDAEESRDAQVQLGDVTVSLAQQAR